MEIKNSSDPVEDTNLQYNLLRKFQVFEGGTPGNSLTNLVSTCNKYGMVFVGDLNRNLKVYHTHNILNKNCDPVPSLTVPLEEQAIYLAVSCNQDILAVAGLNNLYIFQINSFKQENHNYTKRVSFKSITNGSLVALQWNPAINDLIAACFTDGTMAICSVNSAGSNIHGVNCKARCFCWSPKGKNIVIGSEGVFIQANPALAAVANFPAPSLNNSKPVEIMSVYWISNYQFLAVCYQPGDNKYPYVAIINKPKGKTPSSVIYEDVCFCTSTPRPWFFLLNAIIPWNILLVASSNSIEVGTLGSDDGTNWIQWIQDGEARPELPLTKSDDNYPIGMAVNYAIPSSGLGDAAPLVETPSLFVLSHLGLLTVFNIINTKPNMPKICVNPEIFKIWEKPLPALAKPQPTMAVATPTIPAAAPKIPVPAPTVPVAVRQSPVAAPKVTTAAPTPALPTPTKPTAAPVKPIVVPAKSAVTPQKENATAARIKIPPKIDTEKLKDANRKTVLAYLQKEIRQLNPHMKKHHSLYLDKELIPDFNDCLNDLNEEVLAFSSEDLWTEFDLKALKSNIVDLQVSLTRTMSAIANIVSHATMRKSEEWDVLDPSLATTLEHSKKKIDFIQLELEQIKMVYRHKNIIESNPRCEMSMPKMDKLFKVLRNTSLMIGRHMQDLNILTEQNQDTIDRFKQSNRQTVSKPELPGVEGNVAAMRKLKESLIDEPIDITVQKALSFSEEDLSQDISSGKSSNYDHEGSKNDYKLSERDDYDLARVLKNLDVTIDEVNIAVAENHEDDDDNDVPDEQFEQSYWKLDNLVMTTSSVASPASRIISITKGFDESNAPVDVAPKTEQITPEINIKPAEVQIVKPPPPTPVFGIKAEVADSDNESKSFPCDGAMASFLDALTVTPATQVASKTNEVFAEVPIPQNQETEKSLFMTSSFMDKNQIDETPNAADELEEIVSKSDLFKAEEPVCEITLEDNPPEQEEVTDDQELLKQLGINATEISVFNITEANSTLKVEEAKPNERAITPEKTIAESETRLTTPTSFVSSSSSFPTTSSGFVAATTQSIFGTPPNNASNIFAAASLQSMSINSTPTSSITNSGSIFGGQSSTSVFASAASLFPPQTSPQASAFPVAKTENVAVSTSGNVFGFSQSTGSIFGQAPTTSASVFGDSAKLFSSNSVSPGGSIFGTPTNNSGSIFGSAPTTNNQVFPAPTSSAGVFGSPATTAATAFPSQDSASIFGGGTQQSSGSIFGGTSSFSGSIFGGSPANNTPSFSNTKSIFGTPPSAATGFEKTTVFGQSNGNASPNNTFGSTGFQSSLWSGGASPNTSPFGSKPAFGGSQTSSFGGSPQFGGGGFGSAFQKSPSSSFGGSPTFGSQATFGGGATFGSAPLNRVFGETPTASTGFGGQSQETMNFAEHADGNLTFGNLAQQTFKQPTQQPDFSNNPSFSGWRG